MKNLKILLAGLFVLSPYAASADMIYSDTGGLTGSDNSEDFSGLGLADDTSVTNQVSGLTFSGSNGSPRINGCGSGNWDSSSYPGISGDFLNTYGPGCITNSVVSSFTMSFGSVITDASIGFHALSLQTSSSIELLLNGNVVDSVFLGALDLGSSSNWANRSDVDSGWLLFSNVSFDAMRWSQGTSDNRNYFVLDNVSWNVTSVPEPGTLALLGLGLAGLGLRRRRV